MADGNIYIHSVRLPHCRGKWKHHAACCRRLRFSRLPHCRGSMLCVLLASRRSIVGATLWSPQPAVSELRPGLAVTYDYARRVHVDDIEVLSNPVIGKPLDNIAHRTIDGKVLTAKRAMMVAAHIRGLIRFEAPGTYMFRIESNDGVKARIGGQQIWVDPEIHPNRWSPPIPLVIDTPGWYELWINYYQKKGTSALQLVWTVPGSESETHVPPEVLTHLDSQVGQ